MNYLQRVLFTLMLCCVGGIVNAQQRPNILFAIADDWGFGHASAYGCKWVNTPAFDRVAREGLLFTRAYTPNAKFAPALSGGQPRHGLATARQKPDRPLHRQHCQNQPALPAWQKAHELW